ncbi:MAG: Lrp/AsnC family transcriptional regulator [Bradyrhizobiaceae bacterium]|nr:Lrp/AsnC family transcriptional regulator [Bradyrhizobiaceae bacterium]
MKHRKKIDQLDSDIMEALQLDGRISNTDLARRLHVAEGTVRNRIDALLRAGIIQISAWVDPLKVGYQIYAIIEIQVKLKDIESVAAKLAKFEEISFLGICLGGYDIFASAVFRSNEHMHAFLTKNLAGVAGIERASTTSLTRIVKRAHYYSVSAEKTDGQTGRHMPPDGRGTRRRKKHSRVAAYVPSSANSAGRSGKLS